MHIVLLNDDFPLEGGDSVSHLTKVLAERLETFNHRVTIVCTHRTEDSTDVMTGEGDSLVSIPVSYRPSLRSYLSLYNPKVTKMLAQVFARLQPDVVHAHNIHKYLTYDSLRLAKKHTDRVFLTCHDAMSIAFGRVEAPKKLSIGDHIRQVGLQYNPLRNTTIRKKIRRNVKHVTAVSHALGGLLEMNGIPNVHTIHNGVNIDYWKADPQAVETFRTANSLHDKKVLLFSGRLRFEKGIPQLLQALDVVRKSVPNVLLLIVGEKQRWEGLVQQIGVPEDLHKHFLCVGWMSHEQLSTAYGASDVVVTPSVYVDPFVLVNTEAMANAKPVVGTTFGGTPEIVVDRKTGFVRNPNNFEEFAEALVTLLQDESLAKQMGEEGLQRVQEQFTIENMTEKYLKLYTS